MLFSTSSTKTKQRVLVHCSATSHDNKKLAGTWTLSQTFLVTIQSVMNLHHSDPSGLVVAESLNA